MKLSTEPPRHLTYCLNVHRGETWEEVRESVQTHAGALRDRLSGEAPFGLGLRLGVRATEDLNSPETRRAARQFLEAHNFYAFTINGFPYGRFHGASVKEKVYQPDWQTEERLRYTCRLADILAVLLPEGQEGSISTVPGSYKSWLRDPRQNSAIVGRLAEAALHLKRLYEETGKEIHLGLEPEPDCLLESTPEALRFFRENLFREGAGRIAGQSGLTRSEAEETLRRHIGVCVDTCHLALQFEDLAESCRRYRDEGIRLSKIQFSNALEAEPSPEAFEALRAFDEPVYLHQVRARRRDGGLESWTDLPSALDSLPLKSDIERIRVHFHVPLYFENNGPLSSTAPCLNPAFFKFLQKGDCPHLEIETYTFDVFPEALGRESIVDSIEKEFRWVLERLG